MFNRRTIHIFDDAIIANDTIQLYKKTRISNQIFYVISNKINKWKNINSEIKTLPLNSNTPNLINSVLKDNDIVFMQALSYEKAKAIYLNKNPTIYFIWALWGYALYNILDFYQKKNSYSTIYKPKKTFIFKLKEWYTFKIIYPRAVLKIKTCLFLLEADYNMLQSVIPNKSNWMTSCYQTINNIFGGGKQFQVAGNAILLGNSSTPSNNHLKVFEHLNLNKDQKMIVPLSYGDEKYRYKVISHGNQKFEEFFEPMVEFIPLNQFIKKLQICQYTIMGHYRQQAFGTILMMLLAGSKLFLYRKNPLYLWLKEKGIFIYSIEEHLSTELKSPLTKTQKKINKITISKLIDEATIIKQLELVFEYAKTKR